MKGGTPPIAVIVGERDADKDRLRGRDAMPVVGHARAGAIAERLRRMAAIMAACVDVAPHEDEAAWSLIVSTDERGEPRPAAVVTPYHSNGPVGAQVPPSASWIIAPAGPAAWRESRSPIRRRKNKDGDVVTIDDGGDDLPANALRVMLPRYGTGVVMVHPTPPVLAELAPFVALSAEIVAGAATAPTLAQWDIVLDVACFRPDGLAAPSPNTANFLTHAAAHPLADERLTRLTIDMANQLPRHTTHEMTPPGAPMALRLSISEDPFMPMLEPVETSRGDMVSADAMAILRAIEAMRAATGWTP